MQSQTSQLNKHYTLEAGAGAGKTRHLIDQMLASIQQHLDVHNQLPSVITTTFTKKATAEIKERIMKKAVKEKQWKLLNALCDSSSLLVSTLHGILYSFLKNYSETWNHLEIMNSSQVRHLSRSITRSLLVNHSKYLKLLQHYSFQSLCETLIFYDQTIRQQPEIKHLSQKEMQNSWIQYHQSVLNNITGEKSFDRCEPLYQSDDVNLWIQTLLKDKDQSKENKKKFKDLEKTREESHPKYYDQLLEYHECFLNLSNEFQKEWKQQKQNNFLIQIEDLELLTLEITRKQPEKIKSFSNKWDYWFIDEYQDISPIQEELISHLSCNAKKLWVVGDPQQSIYLFRGASEAVFQKRKSLTKKENGHLEKKIKNFRSCPSLVLFFNRLFESHFEPMEPQNNKTDHHQNVVDFLTYENITSHHAIATQLNHLLKITQSEEPQSICILVRDNKEVKNLTYFLKNLKFSVQMHSSNSLKREIIDILFLLKFLIQPSDNHNLVGLLRTPYFKISDSQLANLIQKYKKEEKNIWQILKKNIPNHPVIHSLQTLLDTKNKLGYFESLLFFLEEFLIIDLSFYQDPTGNIEQSLWKFLTTLKKHESTVGFQYSKFVEEQLNQTVKYDVEAGGSSAGVMQPNFIQVMTIHQSKGLEFDFVIVPDIDNRLDVADSSQFVINRKEKRWSFFIKTEENKNILPIQQRKWKTEHRENILKEQKRLLYVATTRAKKHITFICKKKSINKPLENSWLKAFSYFSKMIEKQNSTSYQIRTQHIDSPFEKPFVTNKKVNTTKQSPYIYQNSVKINDLPTKSIYLPCKKEVIFQSVTGSLLHQHLYTLSKAKNKISFLQTLSDPSFQKACQYVLNLKEPPMKQLLDQHAEWGYVYQNKKEGMVEEGRIDLWGEVDRCIWIIDYKTSSTPFKEENWHQLERYANVLQKKYQPSEIQICLLQPLTERYQIKKYNI